MPIESNLDEKQILGITARTWQVMKGDIFKFAMIVKTRDKESQQIRPHPVPDSNYLSGINSGAVVYPHLRPFNRRLDDYGLIPVLKSRRMFATNFIMTKLFHRALFCDKTQNEAYLGIITADKEDKAAEILDRIRFAYYDLPPEFEWIRLINPLVVDNSLNLKFQNGGELRAYSSNPAVYRSEGVSDILADEFAFHPDSVEALKSMRGSGMGLKSRIYLVSTPDGKDNAFYQVCAGITNPDIKPYKMHWTEIPGRDEDWKKRVMREMGWTDADWLVEMEHCFEVALGPSMFPNYNILTHKRTLDITKQIVGLRGWDRGFNRPACVLTYVNSDDQWCLHTGILGCEQTPEEFVKDVDEYSKAVAPLINWQDFAPHDIANRDSTGSTWLDAMAKFNIYPYVNYEKKPKDGWDAIRILLNLRQDGKPGILINDSGFWWVRYPNNPQTERRNLLLEGFQGGFARKQKPAPGGLLLTTDDPVDDDVYIHVFDALNCIAQSHFAPDIFARRNAENSGGKIRQPHVR